MAPVVPTYRPFVTPERAAIAVALVAVACSLFLAFSGARAEPAIDRASLACVERSAALDARAGRLGDIQTHRQHPQ